MGAGPGIATRLTGFDPADADEPLVGLVRKINSAAWARTFGCCAGPAAHGEKDDVYGFYLALAVEGEPGAQRLRAWVEEADRRTGRDLAAVRAREVEKHGLSHLEGWRGFHLFILWRRDLPRPEMAAITLEAIAAMEAAWLALFPA